MKFLTLTILALALSVVSVSASAGSDDVAKGQKKSQQEIQGEISTSNSRIRQLHQDMSKAVEVAKARLPESQEGIGLLKKYDKLLKARYVDDDGAFEPATELVRTDRENINKLFKVYLHWVPLKGRVSAGHARKTIAGGIDTLKDWTSEQESPSADNNSDVQILSKRIQDERDNVDHLTELADNLGYKVDQKAVAGATPANAPARMPSSNAKH